MSVHKPPTWTDAEDERSADWRYLLSLGPESVALVVGCGAGSVPLALARTCGVVYAVDSDAERLASLAECVRARPQGDVRTVHVESEDGLPFPPASFDVVVMRPFQRADGTHVPFQSLAARARSLARARGHVVVSAPNALSLLGRPTRTAEHGLAGYARILRAEGFVDVRSYAPIPFDEAAPLFYIPLDDPSALRFFFRDLFDLLTSVPPEIRRRYRLAYAVARLGRRLGMLLRTEGLARFLMPGFSIFARVPDGDGAPGPH